MIYYSSICDISASSSLLWDISTAAFPQHFFGPCKLSQQLCFITVMHRVTTRQKYLQIDRQNRLQFHSEVTSYNCFRTRVCFLNEFAARST